MKVRGWGVEEVVCVGRRTATGFDHFFGAHPMAGILPGGTLGAVGAAPQNTGIPQKSFSRAKLFIVVNGNGPVLLNLQNVLGFFQKVLGVRLGIVISDRGFTFWSTIHWGLEEGRKQSQA